MLDIKVGDVVMYMNRRATVRRTQALGKDSHCELVFEDTGKHQLFDCKDMMKCACKENGDHLCMKMRGAENDSSHSNMDM